MTDLQEKILRELADGERAAGWIIGTLCAEQDVRVAMADLDELERDGLIEELPIEFDGQPICYGLTAKGREALAKLKSQEAQ